MRVRRRRRWGRLLGLEGVTPRQGAVLVVVVGGAVAVAFLDAGAEVGALPTLGARVVDAHVRGGDVVVVLGRALGVVGLDAEPEAVAVRVVPAEAAEHAGAAARLVVAGAG